MAFFFSCSRRPSGSEARIPALPPATNIPQTIETLQTLTTIVRDMIIASSSASEVGNETTKEMVDGMKTAHQQITAGMERYLEQYPQHVEKVFETSEQVHTYKIVMLMYNPFYSAFICSWTSGSKNN